MSKGPKARARNPNSPAFPREEPAPSTTTVSQSSGASRGDDGAVVLPSVDLCFDSFVQPPSQLEGKRVKFEVRGHEIQVFNGVNLVGRVDASMANLLNQRSWRGVVVGTSGTQACVALQ